MKKIKAYLLVLVLLIAFFSFVACSPKDMKGEEVSGSAEISGSEEVTGIEEVTKIEWVEAFEYIINGLLLKDEKVSFSFSGAYKSQYPSDGLNKERVRTIECELTAANKILYVEETITDSQGSTSLKEKQYVYVEIDDKSDDEYKHVINSKDNKTWDDYYNSVGYGYGTMSVQWIRMVVEYLKGCSLTFDEESKMYIQTQTQEENLNIKLKFHDKKLVYALVELDYEIYELNFTNYGKAQINKEKPIVG